MYLSGTVKADSDAARANPRWVPSAEVCVDMSIDIHIDMWIDIHIHVDGHTHIQADLPIDISVRYEHTCV